MNVTCVPQVAPFNYSFIVIFVFVFFGRTPLFAKATSPRKEKRNRERSIKQYEKMGLPI